MSFAGYDDMNSQPQITVNQRSIGDHNKHDSQSNKEAIYRREETQEYFKKTTFRAGSEEDAIDQNYQSQK